jgi:glucan-binding YG repeat protein
MFKRANKITALLVAAASVMSIVPAMAADSTTTRLDSKDGTIENAVAYSDGKYAYQGYKSSDDTDAIYYNDGNQDKSLDDLSSAGLNTAYADKYAFANDGSDQYLVDLTSGDVTDSTTPVDDADTAATKLQTKLKKTDRYGENLGNSYDGTLTAENNLGGSVDDNKTLVLPGSKFGDIWYSYSVPTKSTDSTKYLDTSGNLYGFTDSTGKYIDASYTANIYAYSTKEGKTVKIDNYSNSYDDVDSDSGLLATLTKQPVVLTQDKDYLYALVTVAITDTDTTVSTGETTTTAAAVGLTGSTTPAQSVTTVRTYVQKISKDQGDQQDGAYLPKTVETYEVGNTNNEYDCSDATDAYNAIKDAINDAGASVTDLADVTQAEVQGYVDSYGIEKPIFTINNGNLVAVQATSDKVDAFTLNFKKDKVKFKVYPSYKDTTTSDAATLSYLQDNKFDAYFLEKDSDDSVDLSNNSNTSQIESYDIDVDGNVWVVADGKIYEYTNGSMTQVYTCDSALDSISVYDTNSLIAWSNNGNVYANVSGGAGQASTDTTTAATTAATTAKTGWDQLADGNWNFYDATGTKVVNNWINAGGVWYFLKADGVMATGWQQVGGVWYYLNASGAMATGWINDNGTWYYLQSSGAMKTGWLNDNGTWYYLNASGAMLANTTTPDGYFVSANGAWIQ